MKTAAIALAVWVLGVPSVVALLLILTFLASVETGVYFVAAFLALTLTTAVSLLVALASSLPRNSWSRRSSAGAKPNHSQENIHETCFYPQVDR